MLTPVAFAPLIRCDGSGNAYRGLTLCTDNFTIPDIVRLMNVLLIRYGIHSDPACLGRLRKVPNAFFDCLAFFVS
jgi:hypothetical protein